MSVVRYNLSSFEGMQTLRGFSYRSKPGHPNHSSRVRYQPARPAQKLRQVKPRRLRCDCGQLAITVLKVRVGTDPQYIIRLPLCAACLTLEQSYRNEG